MAVDRDDSATITAEVPLVPAPWTGHAPPVVMSGDEPDDPSALPAMRDPAEAAQTRTTWDARLAGGALTTVIALVAMLPVAFGLAVATP